MLGGGLLFYHGRHGRVRLHLLHALFRVIVAGAGLGKIPWNDGTNKKGMANKGTQIQGEEIQSDDRSKVSCGSLSCRPTSRLSRTDKRRELRQTINEAKDLRRPTTRRLSVSA